VAAAGDCGAQSRPGGGRPGGPAVRGGTAAGLQKSPRASHNRGCGSRSPARVLPAALGSCLAAGRRGQGPGERVARRPAAERWAGARRSLSPCPRRAVAPMKGALSESQQPVSGAGAGGEQEAEEDRPPGCLAEGLGACGRTKCPPAPSGSASADRKSDLL